MASETLSVVIPAWNEEDGIVQIVERVRTVKPALAELGLTLEIVVVDDGSKDRTASLAAQCADTRVIRHLVNGGYGAALKTGFRHASGNLLAFLDADGTYPPEALPEMYQAMVRENADIIVGSRMSGAKSEMPVTRRVGNIAFAQMLSILSGVRVQDSASGMRLLKRQVLPKLYPLPNGLNFTPAMTTRALNEDIRIVEVPIAYAERIGRSKLSVVRDGVRFTNTIVWTTMTYRPVRVWGGIGLVLGGLAALLAALLVIDLAVGGTLLGGNAPFAAFLMLVLGVLGASIFSFGVMFSYLIAIFTHKPVRRGMFGRIIFDPPLDYYFGRIGGLAAVGGIVISGIALGLLAAQWSFAQLWVWLVLGALLIVVGAQLGMSYLVIRVLDELARREASAQRDLAETEQATEVGAVTGAESAPPVTVVKA
jgi:glycosyltransferase involved in cell wall biosynthesis